MINAVLFDLDGTLVHFDYDQFIQAYLRAVAHRMADLVEPKRFVRDLMQSTEAMIHSLDGTKTNMEIFWGDFPPRVGIAPDILLPRLEEYYTEDFPRLRTELGIRPLPAARELLSNLLQQGYQVVIATSPVFPAMAIEERLRWGEIHDLPYTLVTTYETARYCKPNVEYYAEILRHIGRQPSECIMVGNNTCEDLVAKDLGITTFLVEDCLLDIGPFRREPDHRGSFADLVAFFNKELLSPGQAVDRGAV